MDHDFTAALYVSLMCKKSGFLGIFCVSGLLLDYSPICQNRVKQNIEKVQKKFLTDLLHTLLVLNRSKNQGFWTFLPIVRETRPCTQICQNRVKKNTEKVQKKFLIELLHTLLLLIRSNRNF